MSPHDASSASPADATHSPNPGRRQPFEIRSSPLIRGATEATRPTRWWLAWLVVFGVGVIALGGASAEIYDAAVGSYSDDSVTAELQELATFGLPLLFLVFWVTVKEQRPFRSVGFRGSAPIKRFLVGLLAGVTMLAMPVLVLLATGDFRETSAAGGTTGSAALLGATLLLLVVAVQASTEEALTRGYLLQIGGIQLPAWGAVGLTSVLFAVVHLELDPLVLSNITLAALGFSFFALGQGSLWLVCGIHTGWNWAQGNLVGIPVSGNPRAVSVLAFGPAEGAPDWLTGGSFGIEGSVVTTVVLVAFASAGYRYYRSQQAGRSACPAASPQARTGT